MAEAELQFADVESVVKRVHGMRVAQAHRGHVRGQASTADAATDDALGHAAGKTGLRSSPGEDRRPGGEAMGAFKEQSLQCAPCRHGNLETKMQVYASDNPLPDEAQHVAAVSGKLGGAPAETPVELAADTAVPEMEAMVRVRSLAISWRSLREYALDGEALLSRMAARCCTPRRSLTACARNG